MKIKILIIVNLLVINQLVLAQQQTAPAPSADTKPLELPNFIIEGREQLNVQSGIKQFPDKVFVLSKNQLDSLNSLEKQQSLLLPQKPLPGKIMSFSKKDGYIKGQFGRYTTPAIEGAYNFNVKGYNIFTQASAEHSQGYMKNSDYSKYFIKCVSDYVADEKFFIFGGSKTSSFIDFSANDYKLYASNPAPQRNTFLFNLGLQSEGSYDGFDFLTGAYFKAFGLDQKDAGVVDNSVKGWLKIKKVGETFGLGGNLIADFHAYQGSGVNMIDAYANGFFNIEDLRLRAEAGFQIGQNSSMDARGGMILNLGADYFVGSDLTLKADFSSRQNTDYFVEQVKLNPYLSDSCKIDFGNLTQFAFNVKFEPSQFINIKAGLDYGVSERLPYFEMGADSASFNIEYDKAKKFALTFETLLEFSPKDFLTAHFELEKFTFSNSKEVPFVAPLKFSASYKRLWTENFGSELGILYIGERYSDKANKSSLPGYYDLNIRAQYKVYKSLTLFAGVSNLLNSEVYVWDKNYKERNMFFNIGLMWQF